MILTDKRGKNITDKNEDDFTLESLATFARSVSRRETSVAHSCSERKLQEINKHRTSSKIGIYTQHK